MSQILTGVSGEYFVAAELSRRGFIASITLRNTKGVDILASNQDASKTVTIQVKSNKGKRKSWILNQKAEDFFGKGLFYVFVNLKGENKFPDFHIVPSETVAKTLKDGYKEWIKTVGRKGQKHNDTSMREFRDLKDKYLGKWNILGL